MTRQRAGELETGPVCYVMWVTSYLLAFPAPEIKLHQN